MRRHVRSAAIDMDSTIIPTCSGGSVDKKTQGAAAIGGAVFPSTAQLKLEHAR